MSNSGFASIYTGGGKFEASGSLAHLGIGFFNYMRYPMYKGGWEITFTRAEDNDALYHWKGDTTGAVEPSDGKVVIKSFVLKVPLVEYKATAKIQLIDGLKALSDRGSLIYNYLQWQCIEKKGVFGSSFSIDITNVYRNVYNPRFVIIALQKNRSNSQKALPSRFDSCNVKNFTVKINGERYPLETQDLNINDEKRYRVLYDHYMRFRQVMFADQDMLLAPEDFVNDCPLMVVDTHLHPLNTDRSKSDIQVDLDFNQTLASPTSTSSINAYVIVVSETHFSYDITRNDIKFQ